MVLLLGLTVCATPELKPFGGAAASFRAHCDGMHLPLLHDPLPTTPPNLQKQHPLFDAFGRLARCISTGRGTLGRWFKAIVSSRRFRALVAELRRRPFSSKLHFDFDDSCLRYL